MIGFVYTNVFFLPFLINKDIHPIWLILFYKKYKIFFAFFKSLVSLVIRFTHTIVLARAPQRSAGTKTSLYINQRDWLWPHPINSSNFKIAQHASIFFLQWELHSGDPKNRLEFYNFMLNSLEEDLQFASNTLMNPNLWKKV